MLVVIIVTIICICLMVGLFPLLLRLKPIDKIGYLDVDEDGFLKLDDSLLASFESIKLEKNDQGKLMSMTIYPKENVRFADLTIASLVAEKAKIKGYKLKFKFGDELKITFAGPIDKIAIYVNQINDSPKQVHIVQKVSRLNVEAFIGLEWAGAASVMGVVMWDIMIHSRIVEDFFNPHNAGWIDFPILCIIGILIAAGMYFVLHYVTFWYLGKYIYGGKFDARN